MEKHLEKFGQGTKNVVENCYARQLMLTLVVAEDVKNCT